VPVQQVPINWPQCPRPGCSDVEAKSLCPEESSRVKSTPTCNNPHGHLCHHHIVAHRHSHTVILAARFPDTKSMTSILLGQNHSTPCFQEQQWPGSAWSCAAARPAADESSTSYPPVIVPDVAEFQIHLLEESQYVPCEMNARASCFHV
jgi:hypothetical protein